MPKEKKAIKRYRAITVTMPEEVVALLEVIKKPSMSVPEVVAEIVYKEVRAYVAAQKIIEEESKDPNKIPEAKIVKSGSPIIPVETIVKPDIKVVPR